MIISQDLYLMPSLLKAHGAVMATTFLIVLPLGAWILRLVRSKTGMWLHIGIQLIGWIMMLAGLGLGIKAGTIVDILHKNTHTVLGTIIVILLILQPFIGLIHHLQYKKTEKRGLWSLIHRWYGRALILLGMITGGLGLRLADNTTGGRIAYGVIAGISGCVFLGLIFWSESRNRLGGKHQRSDAPREANVDGEPKVAA